MQYTRQGPRLACSSSKGLTNMVLLLSIFSTHPKYLMIHTLTLNLSGWKQELTDSSNIYKKQKVKILLMKFSKNWKTIA